MASFSPVSVNETFPRSRTACSAAQISALADACQLGVKNPNTEPACIEARTLPANAACAACIFGSKSDAQDHVITLLPNEAPSARFNIAACFDHVTGIPGCGRDFVNVNDCFDAYCTTVLAGGLCSEEGADYDACTEAVADGECKPYVISAECLGRVKADESTCTISEGNAQSFRTLFINFSTVACGALSENDDDGGG